MKEINCRNRRGQGGIYHTRKTEKSMAKRIYFI
jgi:hypothetical protein